MTHIREFVELRGNRNIEAQINIMESHPLTFISKEMNTTAISVEIAITFPNNAREYRKGSPRGKYAKPIFQYPARCYCLSWGRKDVEGRWMG